jgi:origin recognition complex subunit 3
MFRWVEALIDDGHASDVRKLLESDQHLHEKIKEHMILGQNALTSLSRAATLVARIRESLQMSPSIRLSSIWTRAAAGDLLGAPLLRETMLSIKKAPSDKLVQLLAAIKDLDSDRYSIGLDTFEQELDALIKDNAGSGPLRSQDDVRNDSLRTTVIAQKVLLSKHKATLSKQDKAYSDLITRLHDELDKYFTLALIDPQKLFLSEVLIYDLKSPHMEVFQPKPRFSIERALSSPHDYLGCDCCGGQQGEGALSATQPATAILYQLYLESGILINASDLWSAFRAISGDENEEEEESKTT